MIRSITLTSTAVAGRAKLPSGPPKPLSMPALVPAAAPPVDTVGRHLARLLAEPETRLLMKADGVDAAELLGMLIAVSAKLRRGKRSMAPGDA